MNVLAIAVIISAVLALTYVVIEYGIVNDKAANSGWALLSLFVFLCTACSIVVTVGLAVVGVV